MGNTETQAASGPHIKKRFNITGLCNPDRHWMADVSGKIAEALAMVQAGDYFIINRPRQYGKTTLLFLLEKALPGTGKYLPLSISFEGIDAPTFQNHTQFIRTFLGKIKNETVGRQRPELVDVLQQQTPAVENFFQLDELIGKLCDTEKNIVLMIDEVDNASNNQLFLDFLGLLRNKFLERNKGKAFTFHSVILAGVHDVKTLKTKMRTDEDQKLNSPWNIAAPFDMSMDFNCQEISSMLTAYSRDQNIRMDIPAASRKLFYYTSGYPFLVSYLCRLLDEKILPSKTSGNDTLTVPDIEVAANRLLKESNTNFDSLIKNLENNGKLYEFIKSIAVEGELVSYHVTDHLTSLAKTYGMVAEEKGNCKIHNRIYEQLIYE
ncbi:MAG: AAA family ATPase, partial [bacterium]|nr:AAA family ATPase [bacterium]